MKIIDFKTPARLEDAGRTLKELGEAGLLLAKGKAGRTAVDIRRLGLSGIKELPEAFLVGALTPVAELQEFRAKGWALDRVARAFATQQIRNMSTFGGNLARVFRWNDFPVALLALECEMTVRTLTGQDRPVRGSEFLAASPRRFLPDGDILTAVKVGRLASGWGFGYRKEVRTHADFSLATAAVAARVVSGRIVELRAAAGAALPFPKRLEKVESLLVGKAVPRKGLDEDAFLAEAREGCAGLPWKGECGFSDAYAAALAPVAVRDAVAAAVRDAQEGNHG